MKILFYLALISLALFEILNVYFIMPMPGSQQMNSVDLAYFLYSYRWIFRSILGAAIVAGSFFVFKSGKLWIPILSIVPVAAITYLFNSRMTADHMFLQPETLIFKSRSENSLTDSSLVITVALGHAAKAYPIRYIQYHHQVRDTIGGKSVMVTYCNVCRTGRVFEPTVDGHLENFRLVGMDHFNAMFEDETTKSWWRQATGEAITGPLKGKRLPEVQSNQCTLGKFFSLHPFGKVMEAEDVSIDSYDTLGRFEQGKSRSALTRTDSLSWRDKSWVIGIVVNDLSKAYDWNELEHSKIIHDKVGSTPVAIALSSDNRSFIAFERSEDEQFIIRNDSLISPARTMDFAGRDENGNSAEIIKSYQEFWHSWQQFHPDTEVYRARQ